MTRLVLRRARPLVLEVAPRFLPLVGGVPTHVRAIVEELRDLDFVIVKNYTPGRPARVPPNTDLVSVGPVWREPGEIGLGRMAGIIAQSFAERIRWINRSAFARQIRPDLVHVHLLDQDFSWRVADKLGLRNLVRRMVWYCGRLGGNPRKVVFTEHTLLSAPPTIVPEHIKGYVLDAFENVICVERESYRRATEHRNRYGRPGNVWYIPNSADTKAFLASPYPALPPLRVGVVSRIMKPGLEEVVSLARQLPASVELWAAFAGNVRQLQSFQRSIGNARVRVFANVKPEDMPAFYSKIHVFFNQFPYTGVGRTTLEAMASGRPVIAVLRDGVDKYPVTPDNGFLIEEWPQDMISSLESLVNNPGLLESKGQRARRTIENELSHEILIPKLARVYRDVLGSDHEPQ